MAAVPPSQPFMNPQMHHVGYQGTDEITLNPLEAESPATLLIRHLPEAITHEALSRLFSYYGATSVHPCSSGRYRKATFVLSLEKWFGILVHKLI